MMDLFLEYMFIATMIGAARKIAHVIKHKSYRESFNIMGGKDGGGGGGYSPPAAPDPAATAAAQGLQDRKTAVTNSVLLNPNVSGPYGNISYDTNSYNVSDDNNTVNRPTQTIKLSPEQQAQYDLRNQIMQKLGTLGSNWASNFESRDPLVYNTQNIPQNINYGDVSNVGNMNDYALDREKASKAYYDQAYNLMKPDMDRQYSDLQNNLTQTGNPLGSEAYNDQVTRFNRQRNASLQGLADQAVTQGYGVQNQMFNNANIQRQNQIAAAQLPYQTQSALAADSFGRQQTQQNQNINALAALLNGSQAIQNPTSQTSPGYNQSALQSPNISALTQNAYNSQLQNYNNAYNMNMANQNAQTSGLFGIGSAVAGPVSSWLFG
jgi:hypothetical protein